MNPHTEIYVTTTSLDRVGHFRRPLSEGKTGTYGDHGTNHPGITLVSGGGSTVRDERGVEISFLLTIRYTLTTFNKNFFIPVTIKTY